MNPREDTPAIEAVGLCKGFGAAPVLRDLDLTLGWGRVLVIFGANGSGKTTLLRLLSTLYRPDRGQIWVGGLDRSRAALSIRRIIGVVAHQPMLYQNMTCQENLAFFGRMYGLKDVDGRVESVFSKVGLEANRHQRVRTLSHGMQKRLAMGRAILHDPPILLMDEPEAGLDRGALAAMGDLMVTESGSSRTVVMATHNVEWGLERGDEVAVLSGGAISYRANRDSLDEGEFRRVYSEQGGSVT